LTGSTDQGPDAEAVRKALADMLASEPFKDAPQLRAFLSYVVTETLAGRSAELKGYSIATLALGKPETFDPQTDPIVRVQAGRLRQALAEYHQANPASEVTIRLERGSYAPIFETRTDRLPAAAEPERLDIPSPPTAVTIALPGHDRSRRWLVLGGAAALTTIVVAGYVAWPGHQPRESPQLLPPDRFYPTLTVEADTSAGSTDADAIAGRLRNAIARFDDLIVVGDASDMAAAPALRSNASDWNLVLRITALPSGDNQFRIAIRLLNRRDQRLLWSRELDPLPRGQAGDRAMTAAIRTIASALAQPYGVIHAHVRGLLASRNDAQDPFSCVVAGLDYWQVNDSAAHLKARTCIEERLKLYPSFGPLHAQIAYLHLEEYRRGYNPRPGDALGRAIESARKAVLDRPASARSHQSLMAALFARGDLTGAWRAAADALALNPNDTEIIADVGSYRIMAGDYEEGLAYIEQAIDLNPAPPAWVITFRALALYMMGKLELSGPMARTLEGSNYPPAQIALIMAAFQFRDRASGRRHLETFRRLSPEAAADPEGYLRRMNFQDGTRQQIMIDFNRALAWITAE
jgi:tetratricopeptide (TPR) repeat protein